MTTKTPGPSDDGKTPPNPTASDDAGEEMVPKAKFDQAVEGRATERTKRRELETKVAELESKLAELSDDSSEKEGNIERLRTEHASRLQKEKERADLAEQKFKDAVLKQGVMQELVQLCGPKNAALAYKWLSDDFEVGEDSEGGAVAKVKGSSRGIGEWAEEKLTKEGFENLLLSGRKGGSGPKPGDEKNPPAAPKTLDDLKRLTPAQATKELVRNPELRKLVLGGGK